MKIRINKKMFLGLALGLMLLGGAVTSAQAIQPQQQLTCQGAYSLGPSVPVHMNAVGF